MQKISTLLLAGLLCIPSQVNSMRCRQLKIAVKRIVNLAAAAVGLDSASYYMPPYSNTRDIAAHISRLNKRLCDAIENNNSQQAQELIRQGAQVNPSIRGNTPLHVAAYCGHIKIAEMLIDNGANINAQDRFGETPLHRAACRNNPEITLMLINRNAHINAQDESGYTPLHKAVIWGHIKIAKMLIDNGAHINAQNRFGETPLHLARKKQHIAIIQIFTRKPVQQAAASVIQSKL